MIQGAEENIHLAQDRDQWRALLNVVMEPSDSITGGEFLDPVAIGFS
jgi:hypothetical protein